MMNDLKQTLASTTASDRALRDQRHRLAEHQLSKITGKNGATPVSTPEGGLKYPQDDMDVRIDSPITEHHNHYYPQPPTAPTQPAPQSLWNKAAPWIAAAGIATGVGSVGYLIGSKPTSVVIPPATNTTVEKKSGFSIELVQPENVTNGVK